MKKVAWNKGLTVSDKRLRKCVEALWKGRDKYISENGVWNSGCPQTECIKKLSIHHIDYNKNNTNSNNLISLCNSCHSKTNYNKKYWINYFNNITIKLRW